MGESFLPYGRQSLDEGDINAVADVLRGDWLTTGPTVRAFEAALETYCGAAHGIAVNSGTAALHAAYAVAGVGPGDEVIVPALTFSATANAALYLGATVKFADIDLETLTMDPASVRSLITERTKVITPVDFAGHPADYNALRTVADECGAVLVADACHALGASYHDKPVGSVADMTCFSFHPVKPVTTGEGGAIMTDNPEFAEGLTRFRTHGMTRGVLGDDHDPGPWAYDIPTLGYNYRITDFQCALGLHQLGKLDPWIARRQAIAKAYRKQLADCDALKLPPHAKWASHGYHLFTIRVAASERRRIFEGLRAAKIGVQVHYVPVNMLKLYRERGHIPEDTPLTLEAYAGLISLPMFPTMTGPDVDRVVTTLKGLL